ncbi:MAG: YARHG domain-containing protein [Clostridia bacterium]|nr:YARHG domain-containing protein [Clostridia bacterium]
MKRAAIAFVALCSVMALCACSNQSNNQNSKVSDTEENTSVVSEVQKPTLYASPSSVTLYKDSTQQINLSLEGQNIALSDYKWKCDDEKIAKVDPDGVVTGIIPGICTIEAYSVSDPDIKVRVEVTVMPTSPSVNSGVSAAEHSSDTSKKESSDETSKKESSVESSVESSQESSDDTVHIDATTTGIFRSDSPSYDKKTLDDVHDYVQMLARTGDTVSTSGLTKEQAQMLVNTIYATYGYQFSSDGGTIQDGFDQCSWYDGTTSDSYQVIKNIGDKQNIKDSIDKLGYYINTL